MKRIGMFLAVLGLSAVTGLTTMGSVVAQNPVDQACVGAAASSDICNASPENPVVGENGVLTRVTNIVALVTAIASVIVIIVAGLTMTLSSGNSQSVQRARDAIIYAAVGLGIAALARTIVLFIGGSL